MTIPTTTHRWNRADLNQPTSFGSTESFFRKGVGHRREKLGQLATTTIPYTNSTLIYSSAPTYTTCITALLVINF